METVNSWLAFTRKAGFDRQLRTGRLSAAIGARAVTCGTAAGRGRWHRQVHRCVDGPTIAPMPATAGDISLRRSLRFGRELERPVVALTTILNAAADRTARACGGSHSRRRCYLGNSGNMPAVAECIHRRVDRPTTPINLDRRSLLPPAVLCFPGRRSAPRPRIAVRLITVAWAVTRVTAGTIARWQSAPIDALIVPQRR